MAVKTVKKKPRFGAIFVTNFTIFWLCVCLTLTIISIGTNRWYIRHDDNIAFQHGGLWNECMGDIDRTFCSPLRNVPAWLKSTQAFILISLVAIFVDIVYIIVALARKALKLKVMIGFSAVIGGTFFISVIIYSIKGIEASNIEPGSTFIVAWMTMLSHIIEAILCVCCFFMIAELNKKEAVEAGLYL